MTDLRQAMFVIVLLLAPSVQAQQLPELLRAVDEAKARQLIQCNSPWLQGELYAARRYRIVTLDPNRLMKDDDFTVTLFDDTAPLHLTADSIQRREDSIAWNAQVLVDLPEVLRSRGARQTVLLSAVAWDTDQAGRAVLSFDNRNERQSLKRHVFYSVSADFQMLLPRAAYRLVPLKYTPKYHVLFELDPEKIVPILVDRVSGGVVERTPADQAKLSSYDSFIRSLPPDRDVSVVEELP